MGLEWCQDVGDDAASGVYADFGSADAGAGAADLDGDVIDFTLGLEDSPEGVFRAGPGLSCGEARECSDGEGRFKAG